MKDIHIKAVILIVFYFHDILDLINLALLKLRASSLVALMVRRLPAMQEIWVQSLSQKDLREKEIATQSSIFAWVNPIDRGSWQATVHGVAYGTAFL